MPAIRDSVFAQEAVTTDGGLTWPMCNYAEGDLLFVLLIGDVAITSATCSNGIGTWTQLYISNNTVGTTVWWKYAAASGENDVVMTAVPTDTYCGILVSVRDVFQGYTVGSPPVFATAVQAASNKFVVPTISAQTNSLVLTIAANSSVNPSFVFGEGGVHTQSIINGTAEGGTLGWFFQATSGTTPQWSCGAVATGAGVKAVIECRAPAGGATAIPAYCATDACVLLAINPGAAYNGSTALAATADTNFGTSIGGVTAGDSTLAASVTDVGMDPKGFLLTAGMTNAASATGISGAEVVLGVAEGLANTNILGHLRSVTTIASQNLGAISTTRGVWFGLRSGVTANTNYKIWQVHGNDAPYYGVSVVPFVVNPGNADTRASLGTLNTSDVRRLGFWTSGANVLTGQTIIGPVWKMGTSVVAGGTTQEPIGIESLEFALTKGKIRWSVIRQGANQLLCLQAVQFGNGGADPVNLDLNTTAVEFPSQRNATKKLINYNGTDDVIGFTYFAGSSDVIRHRSSVISSPSKYHWRIHASSSALATYDFSGLTLIGAGDVQLRAVTTFTGMTFTSCPTVNTNSAIVTECAFNNSQVFAATLADLDNISNCVFSKTEGTAHAIQVTGTASSIDITNITFTGYAGANGSTGNEAIYVNIASGVVTLNINGGTTPSIRTAGATVNVVAGAVTAELSVTDINGSPIENAQVMVAANTGGPLPYNATVTIANSGTTATVTHAAHGMATGDKVKVKGASHAANNGVFTITVTGAGTYTYTMLSAPGSNPTGTISSTFVALYGTTDVNGLISMTRVFSSNQPVIGWARKSSGAPYYRTGPVSGTINSSTGANFSALLIADS